VRDALGEPIGQRADGRRQRSVGDIVQETHEDDAGDRKPTLLREENEERRGKVGHLEHAKDADEGEINGAQTSEEATVRAAAAFRAAHAHVPTVAVSMPVAVPVAVSVPVRVSMPVEVPMVAVVTAVRVTVATVNVTVLVSMAVPVPVLLRMCSGCAASRESRRRRCQQRFRR
jgi:hypothetical protein